MHLRTKGQDFNNYGMINLENFFRNHFDSGKIGDDLFGLFAQDHIARLKANNPEGIYDLLMAPTEKAYNDYSDAKTTESLKIAQKEAATVDVIKYAKLFLGLVSMKEGTIRGTWGKTSATYQEFYPHGVSEYLRASRTGLIVLMERYIQIASRHMAELPDGFVALFTEVADKYKTSRGLQLSKMGDVSGDKLATARNRTVLEKQLMSNLLSIAKENIGNTDAMKVYFTQYYIKKTAKPGNPATGPGKTLSGTVAATEKQEVMHSGFNVDTEFRFTNTGATTLQFYTTNLPSDPVPGTVTEVAAGAGTTVFASELGSAENLFLMVHNPDTEKEGAWETGTMG